MRALKLGDEANPQTYICAHWRGFPPQGAGQEAEALRTAKTITEEEYQRLLIWQRDCGLMEMDASKCLTCPHRRKVSWKTQGPVLVDPSGVETPVVDMATGEASAHNRHFAGIFQRPGTRGSHQTAAWVPKGDPGPDQEGENG